MVDATRFNVNAGNFRSVVFGKDSELNGTAPGIWLENASDIFRWRVSSANVNADQWRSTENTHPSMASL
jgi:hypothetical protein